MPPLCLLRPTTLTPRSAHQPIQKSLKLSLGIKPQVKEPRSHSLRFNSFSRASWEHRTPFARPLVCFLHGPFCTPLFARPFLHGPFLHAPFCTPLARGSSHRSPLGCGPVSVPAAGQGSGLPLNSRPFALRRGSAPQSSSSLLPSSLRDFLSSFPFFKPL